MKQRLFPILSLCVLSFTACESPSDKVLKEFNKVNESIKKSNAEIDAATANSLYRVYYQSIQLKKDKDPKLAARADELYAATETALAYIGKLIYLLNERDTAGTDTTLSGIILVGTPISDSLKNKLVKVYDNAYAWQQGKEKDLTLDRILHDIKTIREDKGWSERYFKGTPTAGTLTILSKFKSDCQFAAATSLHDIDELL